MQRAHRARPAHVYGVQACAGRALCVCCKVAGGHSPPALPPECNTGVGLQRKRQEKERKS